MMKPPYTGTPWDHYNAMGRDELITEPLGDLRKYATHNCHVPRASKVPGGKEALVDLICKARWGGKSQDAELISLRETVARLEQRLQDLQAAKHTFSTHSWIQHLRPMQPPPIEVADHSGLFAKFVAERTL